MSGKRRNNRGRILHNGEFRESAGELPWNELIGLRNRIVHDYGNVDLNIVFETLKYDIPDLLERLSNSNEQ